MWTFASKRFVQVGLMGMQLMFSMTRRYFLQEFPLPKHQTTEQVFFWKLWDPELIFDTPPLIMFYSLMLYNSTIYRMFVLWEA